MPQKLHPEWGGFDRLLQLDQYGEVVEGAPAKARCQKCMHTFAKTTQEFMRLHKQKCGKPKTTPKKKRKNRRSAVRCNEVFDPSDNSNDDSSVDQANADKQLNLSSESLGDNSNIRLRSSTPTESTSNIDQGSIQRQRQRSSSSSYNEDAVQTQRQKPSSSSYDQEEMSRDDSTLFGESSRTSTSEQGTTHKRKKIIAKRKRPDQNNNDDVASDHQKSMSIYKYILSDNLDFNVVDSKSFRNLLHTFDPGFQIPSEEDLKTTVGLKAADDVYQRNHDKQHNGVLQLIIQIIKGREEVLLRHENTEENPEDSLHNVNVYHHPDSVLAITLLGNTKNEWTYVKHCEFERNHNDDFTYEIEMFCEDSVLQCKKEYGVNVNFILHDGSCNLQIAKEVVFNGIVFTYYTVCELIPVLSRLKCRLLSDDQNHRDVTNFYDQVRSDIPEAIKMENIPMSEAVERLFQIIGKLDEHNQKIVCAELVKTLSPLHLACKVFHPAFHGEILNEAVFQPLYKMFCDFQVETGPELIANAVPYYLDKSGACFRILYSKKREANPIRFWEVTKLDKNIENIALLAEYAINLMQLPAQLKRLNLVEMFAKRAKHRIGMTDFDQVLFTYMLDSIS